MQPLERSSTPSPTFASDACGEGSTNGWPEEGKLPPGWEVGLTAPQIAAVWRVEAEVDEGRFPMSSYRDPKRYYYVRLPKGHPYRLSNGLQRLHRYVVMRSLGRVLDTYEHVHHRPGASLDTTDLGDLRVVEDVDHGHYHYGARLGCGREIVTWEPRAPDGTFTPYPDNEALTEIFRQEAW